MRSASALLLYGTWLLSADAGTADATPPVPLVATVETSSAGGKISAAFDALATTAWCPAPKDAAGSMTIRFGHPVRAKSLVLMAGRVDRQRLVGDWYHPPKIEITFGGPPITIDPTENGQNPLEIEEVRGRTFDTLTIRTLPGGNSAQRCLSDIALELEDGPWLFGAPEIAAKELPAFVERVAAALRACTPAGIHGLAQWPVRQRELQVGFYGAELHPVPRSPRPYATARAMAKNCRDLVFPEGERDPVIQRSIGPGRIRVEGNQSGGVRYWDLVWTRQRWWLEAITFTDFE